MARIWRTLGAVALLLCLTWPGAAAADPASRNIGSDKGPLTAINVGVDLSCQAKHKLDKVNEFFPSNTRLADCGTLVAVDGRLFAPDFAAHDKTSVPPNLGPYTPFAPVSQSAPSGSGTPGDPRRVQTVVDLPGTGITVTETNAYADGQESYRTDVSVRNTSGVAKTVMIYRAGDCHLQDQDFGFGFADPGSASVGCSATANNQPAGRIQQWVPITPGNSWQQTSFSELWKQIATQGPLTNACERCAERNDNAAGIAWQLSAPNGASVSRAHYTTFSPTSDTGGPDQPVSPPGGRVNVGGEQIGIEVPTGCVPRTGTARVRVTSRRKRRIAADRFGFVRRIKILKVDFFMDGAGRVTDRKAAFKAFFPLAGVAADRDHQLSARVRLQRLRARGKQVRIGKKFTVSVSSTLTICP